jgi:hypothetical protein
MTPGPIVADVTELEHRPGLCPEQLAGLERLGFRPIGRIVTLTEATRADRIYGRAERERLAVWRQRPAATLLVARDGTAYAAVDVLGDAPIVRLRTELADGSLVETLGIEPDGILRPRPWISPYAGVTAMAVEDRSVVLLHDASPDTVVAAHREHLARTTGRRGVDPVRHADKDHAVGLWVRGADHARRNQARGTVVARVMMLMLLLVLVIALLWYAYATDVSMWTVVGLELLGGVVVIVGGNVLARFIGRQRWWRVPYRVDEPSG